MKASCETVRHFLSAHLDEEQCPLPPEAFVRHLASCRECAAEADSRRRFLRAVRGAFRQVEVPAALACRLRLRAAPRRLMALVAGLGVLLGGSLALQFALPGRAWGSSLPDEAVGVHEAVLSEAMPLDFHESDPLALTAHLGARLPFAFHLPAVGATNPELQGGRLTHLGGSLAALVVYGSGDEQVSVLVAPRGFSHGRSGQTELFRGVTFHLSQVRRYSVISWDDGELSYALVAPRVEVGRASCVVCHGAGSGLLDVGAFDHR
jgi:anti-sigma factor RsiW